MAMTVAGTEQCMAPRTLDRFDAALGDGIERAMIHHHLRRLRRHGHLNAIAPASEGLWARTSVPPREGNALERFGTVYVVAKTDGGWRFTSLVFTAP